MAGSEGCRGTFVAANARYCSVHIGGRSPAANGGHSPGIQLPEALCQRPLAIPDGQANANPG